MAWLLLSAALLLSSPASAAPPAADAAKSLLWGPGLSSDFNLPVRYVFLQLVDVHGANITQSYSKDGYSVYFAVSSGGGSESCRAQREVVNRRDGSFALRFRLRGPCRLPLRLQAWLNEEAVPERLIRASAPDQTHLCPDETNAPTDPRDLAVALGCGDEEEGVEAAFASWAPLNFSAAVEEAKVRWAAHPGAYSLCHYQVLDNALYRRCYGQHTGFRMFADAALLSLLRKARLPDMELLVNLGDWPLEKGGGSLRVPVVSWCGSAETADLVLPTYELTEATLEMLGRQGLDIQSAEGLSSVPWAEKADRAFWRGRDSRPERLQLARLSRERPDLVHAHITRFFFFPPEPELQAEQMGFGEFFRFRYQVSVDGTVAAYRLPFLLAGDALLLKQTSSYYEHFYQRLRPFVHFVPLKADLSDLEEQVHWARSHPEDVARIIANAKDFVRSHLQPKDVFCYHLRFLLRYASLQASVPQGVLPEMELVDQPSSQPCPPDHQEPRSEL